MQSQAVRAIRASREQVSLERCRRSAHYFIFEAGMVTKDEHHISDPIRPVPDVPYLRVLLDLFLVSGRLLPADQAHYARDAGLSSHWLEALARSGLLLVEKSRQVMATWMACAYVLWRAKYHAHQLILIQSKREDDAANLVFVKEAFVARISFLESHLPRYLQTVSFPKMSTYGHLYFPNGSHIWGIPEGGDIIRSNTASVIISDEMAFQPDAGASFAAALPAIQGGGQYVGLSSANPGVFQEMVEASS